MTATPEQARDDIMGMLKTQWDLAPPSQGILMLYPDTNLDPPDGQDSSDNPTPWARAGLTYLPGFNSALGTASGQRTTQTGFLRVETYTGFGRGGSLSDQLLPIVFALVNQRSANGVWFRNPQPLPVGQDGAWYRQDALVDFTYDYIVP